LRRCCGARRSDRQRCWFCGILGAFGALLFYVVIYPLMLAETPLGALAGASNPLAVWGDRLVPGAPWIILVPVLASTAGGCG